jgi:hypothetical protein
MPDSLANLRLTLPVEVSVAEGRGGGVTAGVVPLKDKDMQLSPEILSNASIRDVLLRAATEVKLFCLFIFPNSTPTQSDEDEAFINWHLIPNKFLASQPWGIRSLPAKHNFTPRH